MTDTGLRIAAAIWVLVLAGVAAVTSVWLTAAILTAAVVALVVHARR